MVSQHGIGLVISRRVLIFVSLVQPSGPAFRLVDIRIEPCYVVVMARGTFDKKIPLDARIRSFGKRHRWRGKQVLPSGSPLSHSGATGGRADAGFECGQNKQYDSRTIPGLYRVSMPSGRTKYSKPVHPQT